ncbi:MAG: T9SS type A sorting domain-containing protein [Microscillaceae bacterium]|jgi:hypothetical protein|nr:T9SS type A sorting domain-containing protein [Microscillaceae bacterium]
MRTKNISNNPLKRLSISSFGYKPNFNPHFLVWAFLSLFIATQAFGQSQCNINCGETVGGQPGITSWNKVKLYTKGVNAVNYGLDVLSSYTMGGVGVVTGVTSHGIGVVGPYPENPTRWNEINYIPESGRSEKLLFEFPNCQSFTGANITLSRFYALENGDEGEAGCWRAFDANFNQVGGGTFYATQPTNSGLFNFEIRAGAPFRYLEFTAKPYSLAKTTNSSDYLVQRITPTCFTIPSCDDLIGGTNAFSSWQQAVITTRPFNTNMFFAANPSVFVSDAKELPGSSGLGVPNDSESEINFDPYTGQSEALRLDLGARFTSAQFKVARLFNGEIGYWVAYNVVGCELVAVASGEFLGDEESDGTLKGGGVTGQRTVTVSTESEFQVVEFTSGPTQTEKEGEEEEVGSGYVLHQFVPCPECSSGAYEVLNYTPGVNKDGTTIAPEFSNTENAIGSPQDLDDENPVNFVSLGFDGSITLKFALPFTNGVGPDLQIFETSSDGEDEPSCESNPERADVFASQNGVHYVYLGTICQDGSVDLGSLEWAWYVRIIDASKRGDFWNGKANGFDLDGIKCLNGPEEDPKMPEYPEQCNANFVKNYAPGRRKDGTPITATRQNMTRALGEPDSFDTFANATSLGFSDGASKGAGAAAGFIELGFQFPIFDRQSVNDVLVIETSFGNPQFRVYPEQAEVYASKNGADWVLLGRTNTITPGVNCQITLDTEFDFSGKISWAQFIKVVDVTNPNALLRNTSCTPLASRFAFGGGADAFDVDAVVCSYDYGDKKKGGLARTQTRRESRVEIEAMKSFPNPAVDFITLDFSEAPEFVTPDENRIKVKIYTAQGRLVQENTTEISGDFASELNVSTLPSGMYILKLEAGIAQKTLKFVK